MFRYRLKSAIGTFILVLVVAAILPDLHNAGRHVLRFTIGTAQHAARFVDHGLGALKPGADDRHDDDGRPYPDSAARYESRRTYDERTPVTEVPPPHYTRYYPSRG
jgi:hypothetical protein